MKIIVEKTLEEFWATPEDFAGMTDKEVLDLLYEDLGAFLEGAHFTVVR